MPSSHEIIRCRYNYDPLDRLVGVSPSADAESRLFYCKTRLATEIHGLLKRSIFQHGDQLLAQQQSAGAKVESTMLATDRQRSVLHSFNTDSTHPVAYSPYGYNPFSNGFLSLLQFNGERSDPVTGHYLLGNGFRAFNPVLMRFNSPDSLSPFGDGGLNPYAYCLGDPVNRNDPTGHVSPKILVDAVSSIGHATASLPKIAPRSNASVDSFKKIIGTVSKSFDPDEAAIFKRAEDISNSNKFKHQIAPGRMQNAEDAAKRFDFYNSHSKEFNFTNGIPQVGELQSLPSGSQTYLQTLHFDAAVVHYTHQLKELSGVARKIAAANLRSSVLNRANYIVRHSQKLPHDNIRAPRGASPV